MRRTYLIILGLLVVLSFVSCKSSKKQASVAEPGKTESASAAEVQLDEPVKVDNSADKKDASATDMKQSSNSTESLFVSMKKTPCYGRCPIYEVKIYQSGKVIYDGKRFVEREGVYSGKLSKEQMEKIAAKAREIGYFDLEDEYNSPVTDFPSTYTTVNLDGKSKTIKNRVGGPLPLKAYEKLIEEILDKIIWTKIADNNQ